MTGPASAAGSSAALASDSAVLTGPCLDSSVSLPYEESYLETSQAAGFVRGGGFEPMASGFPTVTPQPQWVPTTLPMDEMVAADTGTFVVRHNTEVTEVPEETPPEPPTTTCPAAPSPGTVRPDGPTPGSQARQGGGGSYLANEVAYRATLLRDPTGLNVPGGHIHTSVLDGLGSDPDELSTPRFESNRTKINDQVRALVRVQVGTLPSR